MFALSQDSGQFRFMMLLRQGRISYLCILSRCLWNQGLPHRHICFCRQVGLWSKDPAPRSFLTHTPIRSWTSFGKLSCGVLVDRSTLGIWVLRLSLDKHRCRKTWKHFSQVTWTRRPHFNVLLERLFDDSGSKTKTNTKRRAGLCYM